MVVEEGEGGNTGEDGNFIENNERGSMLSFPVFCNRLLAKQVVLVLGSRVRVCMYCGVGLGRQIREWRDSQRIVFPESKPSHLPF
jgi:hypothetical protein